MRGFCVLAIMFVTAKTNNSNVTQQLGFYEPYTHIFLKIEITAIVVHSIFVNYIKLYIAY